MESKFIGGNQPENSSAGGKRADRIMRLIFFISILVFFTGYNFSDNPPSGWYLQTMPDLNGASVKDITFTDSLNGYAVTNIGNSNSYILKTTNGGDNWSIVYTYTYPFSRVEFVNANTGFTNGFTKLFKTTNTGDNWDSIDLPGIFGDDMFVLNKDTIWLAMSESLTGGVYRTTNGGINWTQQLSAGNQNPDKIYMYNARIGFICKASSSSYLRKTTDGGNNWFSILSNEAFTDMYFIDSLTGWRAWGSMKRTTNGGVNWNNQSLPQGGNIVLSQIISFSNINNDTIWGGDGYVIYPNSQLRGILYRTTNGGTNWHYQIPDTSLDLGRLNKVRFYNRKVGWAYEYSKGIHTVTGGDTTFLSPVREISVELPKDYSLSQNYPNPFNQSTIFNFQCSISGHIIIKVYDISGKELMILVNERKPAGKYEVRFDAGVLSSGIYFYSLTADGKTIETKKAVLIK